MTRDEHMEWCKQRALEYIDRGDVSSALGSMMSDLGKHEETKDHPAIQLGAMLLLGGHLSTAPDARRFIEGFN